MSYKEDDKLNIPVRADVIELIAHLVVSQNTTINFKDYYQIDKLFNIINFDNYNGDLNRVPVKLYIEFINFVLDLRLNKKVNNINFIKGRLTESKYYEAFQMILNNIKEVSNEDLQLVRIFISERLRLSFIYENQHKLEEFLLDLRTNGFNSLEDLSERYKSLTSDMFLNIVNTTVQESGELNDVVLDETGIKELALDTYNTLNVAGNELKLCIKRLDEKLGGNGITRGETALFGAPSGHGKSVLLLNLAYNIKRGNLKVETRDKTRKPLVLYVSLENTPRITYSRFAKLLLNYNKSDLKSIDPTVIAEEINNRLNGENSGNIKLDLIYRKANSFSVNDLRTLILEKENEGYEVIAVCLDYLKLLKSRKSVGSTELRHIMSDLSRDLADLAIEKNVAMISAFQLNRSAIQSNTLDLTHVAEALNMIDHVDYTYLFRRGYDVNTKLHYFQMFDGKERNTDKDNTAFTNTENYFILPFTLGNSIELEASGLNNIDSSNLIYINTKGNNNNNSNNSFAGNQNNQQPQQRLNNQAFGISNNETPAWLKNQKQTDIIR